MLPYAVPTTLYKPLMTLFPHRKGADDVQDYLASFAVEMVRGDYLVRNRLTNEWALMPKQTAVINLLTAQHAGQQSFRDSNIALGRETITAFVKREIPLVNGWAFVPGGPPLIMLDGKVCVNRFNGFDIVAPVPDNLFTGDLIDRQVTMFMRLIRESLCNREGVKSLEAMIDIANGDDPAELEFRFLMHWLAAVAQNPGINLETNIWLIGETKGIGKGTLTRMLRLIYGRLIGRAPAGDFERGWTNDIEGHLFYEVDEFDSYANFDWGKFIKRDTTNQIIKLVMRNYGGYDVINITNWIFHSNNENPLPLERDDRRNFQILTTNNPAWKMLALSFNQWLNANPAEAYLVAAAFAAVLNLINVDMNLIALAPATEIRDDNQEFNRNAVERWIIEDERYPRDAWTDGRELFWQYFEPYKAKYFKNSGIVSAQSWGLHMAKLVRRKHIQRRKGRANVTQYLIPAANFPVGEAEGKPSNIVDLVNRLRDKT